MFSLQVTDTDKFLDMPTSTQALYFHLGMHGDDDGFVPSPRKIARGAGCNDDDLRILASKGFIIPFENGVVVITDWRVNNTLKNDRYHETIYKAEKAQLVCDDAGRYAVGSRMDPERFQNGSNMEPEHNITKHNITKYRVYGGNPSQKRSRFTPPTVEQVSQYVREQGYSVDPVRFVDHYESNGWMVGKNKMKDWKAAVRNWNTGSPQNASRRNVHNPSGTLGDAELEAIQRVLSDSAD